MQRKDTKTKGCSAKPREMLKFDIKVVTNGRGVNFF